MGLKNMNGFFEDGLENAEGMTSNGYVMKITKSTSICLERMQQLIYKKIWHNKLDGIHPKIKFEIHILEDYIK